MKKKPVCSECGGTINFSSVMTWSVEKQEHVIVNLGRGHCINCLSVDAVKWVSAEPDLILKAVAYEDIPVGSDYLYKGGDVYSVNTKRCGTPDTPFGDYRNGMRWLLPEVKDK